MRTQEFKKIDRFLLVACDDTRNGLGLSSLGSSQHSSWHDRDVLQLLPTRHFLQSATTCKGTGVLIGLAVACFVSTESLAPTVPEIYSLVNELDNQLRDYQPPISVEHSIANTSDVPSSIQIKGFAEQTMSDYETFKKV